MILISSRPFGFSPPAYREAFEAFEAIMTCHSGRPHWSKRHPLTPSRIGNIYPCFSKFLAVLDKYDSSGVFRNDYVKRHLFGEDLGEKFALQ
jgi:L-gulonolactone oxidase